MSKDNKPTGPSQRMLRVGELVRHALAAMFARGEIDFRLVAALVTRTELLQLVWGYKEAPVTRTVDSFIFRLRRKIEPDPHHPRYIRTAHGDGYRLTTDE